MGIVKFGYITWVYNIDGNISHGYITFGYITWIFTIFFYYDG